MEYLKSVETALQESIFKVNNYLVNDKAYTDMRNLAVVDSLLNSELRELQNMYSQLASLIPSMRRKYDADRAKYKNEVLYGKRLGKIVVDREKERTYHKAEKGYKQCQHTHYKFAMEVATENGIILHKASKECVWRDKQTKEDSISEIKNLLNREYFVNPQDVEVLEA